jgi:hypothetical protein
MLDASVREGEHQSKRPHGVATSAQQKSGVSPDGLAPLEF